MLRGLEQTTGCFTCWTAGLKMACACALDSRTHPPTSKHQDSPIESSFTVGPAPEDDPSPDPIGAVAHKDRHRYTQAGRHTQKHTGQVSRLSTPTYCANGLHQNKCAGICAAVCLIRQLSGHSSRPRALMAQLLPRPEGRSRPRTMMHAQRPPPPPARDQQQRNATQAGGHSACGGPRDWC